MSGSRSFITLKLDDRDGSNADAGPNSGTTSGTLSGVSIISGSGTLDVQSGTWTLADGETYDTAATVEAPARFIVNGSLSGATLAVMGTLSGTGTVAGVSVQSGGTIVAGDGSGSGSILHTGNVALVSGAHFSDSIAATTADSVSVTGSVSLDGATLDLSLLSGSAPTVGTAFTLIANDGTDAISGTFANYADNSTFQVDGHSYSISYHGGSDNNDVVVTRIADAVPPPSGGGGGDTPTGGGYYFATIAPAQAAGFRAIDSLIFPSGATAGNVFVTSASGDGVTLSYGGKSVAFGPTLAQASLSDHLLFSDASHLLIGLDSAADRVIHSDAASYYAYGRGGDDVLSFGDGANAVNGGMGSDVITGGNGNNHIWGNAIGSPQGQADGGDTITVGAGTNFIQGNAGNDIITAGVDGSTGYNRIFGGADQDQIIIRGAGVASVNGNMGNDTIDASAATGVTLLRGGQGDDIVRGGHGQDQLLGDLGQDTLVAGTGGSHLTVMTGGADADLFDLSNGAAAAVQVGGATFYQSITDFAHGTDHIGLAFTVGGSDVVTGGPAFSDAGSAEVYAQQMLSSHGDTTGIAAIQVGSDTYLFYDAGGNSSAIDSIVVLNGVTASTLSSSDFVHIGS